MVIRGLVVPGTGNAGKAFGDARKEEVRGIFGWEPYPGTLNLQVASLEKVLCQLPEPLALTEHDTPIGPLQWWAARIYPLRWRRSVPGALVRGRGSEARFLEIVVPEGLRELGVEDGDSVNVILFDDPEQETDDG